jgi:hypothetical protein
LFFDSVDGLVPQDTNGVADVYEFEPEGVGGCTGVVSSATQVFVGEVNEHLVDGCVGLLSSGTSSSESAFYDASENGDVVFFDTTAKLVAGAQGTSYHLYDAHVCSSGVPCLVEGVLPPPCANAEACRPASAPQPEFFGPPSSESFHGAGNPAAPAPGPPVVKKKTVKCSKGKRLSHGRCVKAKVKHKAKAHKARKAGVNRGAGR